MKRLLLIGNIIAIALVIGYGLIEYGRPAVAARVWRAEYKDLMFKCDQVMREHFIAKREVEVNPGPEAVKNLEASEVGLLDCHEYDKMRKRMLAWGLALDQLSAIGLEALEEKKYELRDFVNTHEIRY